MSMVLVDTNVVSFLFRGHDPARDFLPYLAGHDRAVSFQTVAELYEWAESAHWGENRKRRLLDMLRTYYIVIPVDDQLCLEWAKVRSERYRIGRAISESDAWIAATARLYDLTLVTDDSDFAATEGLKVLP